MTVLEFVPPPNRNEPTRVEVEQLVRDAWRLVRAEEPRLDRFIAESANDRIERAAVFRLALHLDALVSVAMRDRWPPKYSSLAVDVELARAAGGMAKIGSNESPDVVVHGRGIHGPNLLALECKMTSGWRDGESDRRKLRALTDGSLSTRYQFAARVKLDFAEDLTTPGHFEWFPEPDATSNANQRAR